MIWMMLSSLRASWGVRSYAEVAKMHKRVDRVDSSHFRENKIYADT